jgi:hypothetical protein
VEAADEGREHKRTGGYDADRGAGRVVDSDGRSFGGGGRSTECAEIHRQLADDQSGADYTVTPPTSGNLNVARDQDLYDFTTNIVNFGGSTATGTIALNQRVYTITINWNDSRAANAAGTTRSFVLTSRAAVDPVATP